MDNKSLGLVINKDRVIGSSVGVANIFNKDNYNVIRDIETKIIGVADKSFTDLNFEVSEYKDNSGKKNKMYLMTKDGFTLLAMGFTGKKAIDWKIEYLNEFNRMESVLKEKQSQEWLRTRKSGKMIRRNETDKLKLLLEYAIANGSKTYANKPNSLFALYTKLVNNSVGIATGERETCVFKVLSTIIMLEDMIQHTVVEEINKHTDYHEIYYICKVRCSEMMRYAYLPEIKLLK